jgi:hypothetical protein
MSAFYDGRICSYLSAFQLFFLMLKSGLFPVFLFLPCISYLLLFLLFYLSAYIVHLLKIFLHLFGIKRTKLFSFLFDSLNFRLFFIIQVFNIILKDSVNIFSELVFALMMLLICHLRFDYQLTSLILPFLQAFYFSSSRL